MRNIPIDRATAMLSVIREFQHLPPKDIEMVAAACQWHRYDAGNEIVRYHDHTNSAFFIVQGEIRVMYHSLSGQEVILCDLPTGEMFGELTAIDGHPRSATAIARTSTLLASMPALDFKDLVYSNRLIAETILKRLTGQVRRLTETCLRLQHIGGTQPDSIGIAASGKKSHDFDECRDHFSIPYPNRNRQFGQHPP